VISLRAQLLLWLLPLYLLSAAVILVANYLHYRDSTSAFMDGQMHRLALAYVQQLRDEPHIPALTPLDAEHVEQDGTVIVQFWNQDGQLVADNWVVPGLRLQAGEGFHSLDAEGHAWRVYTTGAAFPRLQLVQSDEFRRRVALHTALEAAEPVAVLIPVSAVLLWLAVWLALRPLERVVQAIVTQDEDNLAALPLQQVPAELRPLIASMNGLLARLREAFAARQRFVQDAAHELRTPLTALKLQVQNLRDSPGGGQDMAHLEAGLERMQRLVQQLLRLARQEAAITDGDGVVELDQVLRQCLQDFVPLAAARRIDLGLTAAEPVWVQSDLRDLRGVLDNLLENALHYTPPGGQVDVALIRTDEGPRVEIRDTGPGIPEELLQRVFDRFFRVPGSRADGSGLGLAIARHAAERAGLHLELQNRTDRSGLLASVQFPG